MKLIDSSVEILPQEPGLLGVYQQIERAGRTCYKSEDKITEDSAKAFVDMLINRGHTAPLEHGTIYLTVPNDCDHLLEIYHDYNANQYSSVAFDDDNLYVTTNARVIGENNFVYDLQYISEPTKNHILRTTAKFILSIGIANEFVRHRTFSFCQESSRYCNYSKSKFGSELTFIKPSGLNSECTSTQYDCFIKSLEYAEDSYMNLLNNNLTAQQAREVLPKAAKTELVMTGFNKDGKNFFDLRCSVAAHPDARKLATELKEKINDDYAV